MIRTPLRTRSSRRIREQARRNRLTAEILELEPWCGRCGDPATELHEPQKRSRNPKAWLDPLMVAPSCRPCNEWAEREPEAATAIGWLIPSWVPYPEAVAAVAKWRQT